MKIAVISISASLTVLLAWWLIFSFERRQVYQPSREIEGSPADIGLDYEELFLRDSGEEMIHGWFIPSEKSRATLLFCHGNAGNISHRLESIAVFNRIGLDVCIFDYRGYGKSSGSPSEEGTYRDGRLFYDYLKASRGIPAEGIIIFGRSLGSAVAVQLAGRVKAAALICESAFTSAVDLGKLLFPHLPARLLVFDRYDSSSRVGSLDIPKLFIHSREDDLVPFEMGRELFEAAAPPKEFLAIRGGHGDGFLETGAAYQRGIESFLDRYLPGD